ncbi:MAG: hypothetical protein CMO81_05290 [Waddliaceae bacterium]|nr:hypothetical protein [Waddliaceae bacterium]
MDSIKGDRELAALIDLLASKTSDINIIAMDSNVAATHPRLNLLKENTYRIDYKNYLEATCTNPWQILDTRIDWIAIQAPKESVSIENIPVRSIGLNSLKTNMSDHKPIAAGIHFFD